MHSYDSLQTWNHIGLIPVSAVIAFFFFGIEELAVQLEEPFSILPLQNMTDGMGLSAKEYADWHFELQSDESRHSTNAFMAADAWAEKNRPKQWT